MKRTTIAVLTLLAITAMAGCLSPADKGKTQEATKDDLRNHHILIVCQFATDGITGVHVDLRDCDNGRLTSGHINEVEVTVTGQKDVGTWRANRQAEVTTTVYYPTPFGNSQPHGFTYSVESGKTGGFDLAIRFPVDVDRGAGVIGVYNACFHLGGYKDTNTWMPGLQGKPDPTTPDPTCVKYQVGKGSLIGGLA